MERTDLIAEIKNKNFKTRVMPFLTEKDMKAVGRLVNRGWKITSVSFTKAYLSFGKSNKY